MQDRRQPTDHEHATRQVVEQLQHTVELLRAQLRMARWDLEKVVAELARPPAP